MNIFERALITGLVLFGCIFQTSMLEAQQNVDISFLTPEEEQFRDDILTLQQLVEEALAWRLEAKEMYAVFEEKINADIPLSHAEIELIHVGSNYYLEIREKILVYAHKYKKYVAINNQVEYAPGQGTMTTLEEGVELDFRDYYSKFQVDPQDKDGRLTLNRLKLSLAASLVLYDNYLVAIYPYQKNSKLRQLINFDNIKASRKLDAVTLSYLRLEYRAMVQKALRVFNQDLRWRDKNNKETGLWDDYLDILITGSLSYKTLQEKTLLSTTVKLGGNITRLFKDNVNQFSRESMNIISSLIGNTLGLMEIRKGKMKNLSRKELHQIEKQLQPLDILLEKTPFRLTDKFIPGYYGHVAVWVGSPEDWEQRGVDVLNNPIVRRNLEKINKGKKIVEALRQGVKLSSLKDFMNIDDLVILRHKDLTKEQKTEYLVRALAQVGKKYDFNFDVETDKKIVCSELAYVIFHDIDWKTEKSIGRYTISPDNVAQMALKNGPLEVVELYHDGKQVDEEPVEYFAMLLTSP